MKNNKKPLEKLPKKLKNEKKKIKKKIYHNNSN